MNPDMILLYNMLTLAAAALAFPWLVPLILLSEKRRKTAPFRLGFGPHPFPRKTGRPDQPRPLWVHALSVGETLSALPLVKALGRQYGRERLLFSASTFTGYQIACEQLAGHAATICFFPYDLLPVVHHRLRQIQPAAVVIVETDLWPNFLTTLQRKSIPAVLVNARLSENSLRGYQRLARLFRPALSVFHRIGVQTAADACRFKQLGVPEDKIIVTGNMKFDQALPTDPQAEARGLKKSLGINAGQIVLLAGSTHPAEEPILQAAFSQLRTHHPELVLIMAPRDPGRALGTKRIFTTAGFSVRTLKELPDHSCGAPWDVLVVDSMGRLRNLYAVCDIAFIGGSLGCWGGHNPLEPAAYGKPILFGPDMRDFQWIADELKAAGAARTVCDGPGLSATVLNLINSPQAIREMGQKALAVFTQNQGALENSLKIIAELM